MCVRVGGGRGKFPNFGHMIGKVDNKTYDVQVMTFQVINFSLSKKQNKKQTKK